MVLGGESFQSLAAGLQDALWMAGGVPQEHRTDSLSAAFNNLAEREELTARYQALCQHYGMRPTRNNTGVSHENGAIEARQGSLKRGLDQGLLLRGSREFDDLPAYEQFVAETVRRLNARCARAWEAERVSLKPLPTRRTADFEELDARVSKFGVFSAKSVLYSVPSRLAGQRLKVRLHSTHLDAWLGGVKVFECERLHASTADRHPRRIDWRHMLPSLKRKPGAFARWVLRDAMFPRSEYAQAWDHISRQLPERVACRLMVDLLDLADRANVVAELAGVLAALLARGELPDIELLRDQFAPRPSMMPDGDRGAALHGRVRRVAGGSMSSHQHRHGRCQRIGRRGAADAHRAAPAHHQAAVGRPGSAVQPRRLAGRATAAHAVGPRDGRARDAAPGARTGRQPDCRQARAWQSSTSRRCRRCPRPM